MDFPLYFQKVIWQWRNLIFTKKNSEKVKPLRIYPSIRFGGFQNLIFPFVHYHRRLRLSPQEIHQASPSGFPLGSGYKSPYSPPLVTIQIQYA